MITTYAFGRNLLAPQITISTGGKIQGGNSNYYFWYKGRNRAGYSVESAVLELQIPNNSSLNISGLTFDQLAFEDWRSYVFIISTTNDINNGRIFFERNNIDENENFITNNNVVLDNEHIIFAKNITNVSQLPTDIPNGFRITLNTLTYKFVEGSNKIANNVTVIAGLNGNWELLTNTSLIEPFADCDLALELVGSNDLLTSSLNSIADIKPVKFYIINNSASSISGELNLNIQTDNNSTIIYFNVRVIGYLDLTNFTLDTVGLNTTTLTLYPQNKITLVKSLLSNNACVIEVTPDLGISSNVIFSNTNLSLYPTIVKYTLLTEPQLVGEPVANISALETLNLATVRDGQMRHVRSKKRYYFYDANSVVAADGNYVIAPVNNSGRWLSVESEIRDGSITLSKLASSLQSALSNTLTSVVDISTGSVTAFTIDFALVEAEYIRLQIVGIDAITPVSLNFIYSLSLATNTSVEKVIELNYGIAPVIYDNSIRFPDDQVLVSGVNSKDLLLVQILKDSNNIIIKRAIPIAQDV